MPMPPKVTPRGKSASPAGTLPFRIILGIWITLCVLICTSAVLRPHSRSVYPIFADAGRCWLRGADNYDYHGFDIALDQYRYSPAITLLFVPLGALPDAIGGLIWRLLNIAVYFGGLVAFCRHVWPGRERLDLRGAAIIGWMLLPLSLQSLGNGQPNALVIGSLMFALTALRLRKWNWATLALGVPIFFKLYPIAVALLVILAYPRRMGWRIALCVAVGVVVPFAAQEPAYVYRQYVDWFARLAEDDRSVRIMTASYRDLELLLRVAHVPISHNGYRLLQVAGGALMAGIVFRLRQRQVPDAELLRHLLALGCGWMTVLGPATESSTFILMAPVLALAVWQGFQGGAPVWTRVLLAGIVALFVTSAVVSAVPDGTGYVFALNPLAALLLLGERLVNACAAWPQGVKSAVLRPSELAA